MADELGPRHPGQTALDKRAVRPGRVQRPEVGQPVRIHVHAPQVESPSAPLIQFAVQADKDLLPCRADRAPSQGNEVEVTDTRDVIPGGQGTRYQQVSHPAKAAQAFGKQLNNGRHAGHPGSLRARIRAQHHL